MLIGLAFALVWRAAFGSAGLPPSDNDALVHSFTMRRLGEMTRHAACLLPRDTTTEYGIRFVPCGSHLLRYFDFVGISGLGATTLNSLYLVSALVLPIGVGAFLEEIRPGDAILHRTGAVVSLLFLVFPYGLNGLMPFLMGLTFVFPVMSVLHRTTQSDWKGVVLSLSSWLGLALIHPTAAFLSLLGLIGLKLTRRAVGGVLLLGGLLALTILLVTPSSVRANLIDGISTGSSLATTSGSISWERLFLGSPWSRPQPLLLIICLFGLYVMWRSHSLLLRGIVISWTLLFTVWISLDVSTILQHVVGLLFYGNWYRILGALELLSIPGVALGLTVLLRHVQSGSRQALGAALALLASVSIGTGYRIVSHAWSRPSDAIARVTKEAASIPSELDDIAMNDSTDGTAWAYGQSNIKLLAPVDRPPDTSYAAVIDNLGNESTRPWVCHVINNSETESVLLTSKRSLLASRLVDSGVLYPAVYESDNLALYQISQTFRSSCQELATRCVREESSPEWFKLLVEQRFNRPATDIYCK